MDIKEMALWAIEYLASSEGEPTEKLVGNIYSIAHAVLAECSAPHEDWIALTKEVFAEGALQGYCPSGRLQRERFEKAFFRLHKGGLITPAPDQASAGR